MTALIERLEAARQSLIAAKKEIATTQAALHRTPEHEAHEAALATYFEAEEYFAGSEGYAGFCEGCGIPLKTEEAEHHNIGHPDDGDTAPFCKDAKGCNERCASLKARAP